MSIITQQLQQTVETVFIVVAEIFQYFFLSYRINCAKLNSLGCLLILAMTAQ